MVTTAIPVTEALGEQEPGVYVTTARLPDAQLDYWEPDATQWFVISDLGLTTLTAGDGLHAVVRSRATAEPMANVVNASLPRFLHFGDSSRLLIEIDDVIGPAGDYRVLVKADQGVGIDPDYRQLRIKLEEEARATLVVPITGDGFGDFEIRVTVLMPDGTVLPKNLILGVRPPGLETTIVNHLEIPAGGGTLTLSAAALSGYVRGTGSLSVSAGGAARLDVVGILAALDRYPYGCSEQTTSRALPLLYLDDAAASVGIGADTGLATRIDNAIAS